MNDQLIQQIRETIKQLTIERQSLQEGSKAYKDKSKALDTLSAGLSKLTGETRTSLREITRLTSQFEKLFQTLGKGESARISLGTTGRLRTRELSKTYEAAMIEKAFEESAQAVPLVTARTRKAPFTVDTGVSDTLKQKQAIDYTRLSLRELEAQYAELDGKRDRELEKELNRRRKEEEAARRRQRSLEREAELLAKKAAQEQKIADFQRAVANLETSLPGGKRAATELERRARQINPEFTRDTIQSMETEGSSRITKVKYAVRDSEGIMQKATFTVDRFGTVLEDTQRRFQTFGTAVRKDITEVLKWSVAVAVVYGPMQKLGELMQDMVKNEAALADITVTLGNVTQDTAEIFNAASEAAQATGDNLDDVLKAYNAAYRATGEISDSTERFATANKLLEDSLILSKLAGLEEVEAIDTLTAALRQSGLGLNQGRELLDKWVKVTRVANVDLITLATGFSIVGDAADSAGIKAEDLAGILATIAETSISSGREVANTARAIISGFQSDNARKELTALGISLEDSTGNARNFLEVINELRTLSQSGVITNEQFNRLTLAIGGGTRRQAAVSAFISNSGKIAEITKAQQNATGAAAEAMGKKLDTVQTSLVRLDNAFQSLAQSLGDSGGLLDLFKTTTDLTGGLITAFAKLAEVAGKAGPALAVMAAIRAFSGGTGGAKIADTAGRLGNFLGTEFFKSPIGGGLAPGPAAFRGQAVGAGLTKALPYIGGALGMGVPLAQNLLQGNEAQAAGNAVGGAAGAAIGLSLGGPVGAAIGATIGSAIGESFVNVVENYKPTFDELFAPAFAPEEPQPEKKTAAFPFIKEKQDRALELLAETTGADTAIGKIGESILTNLINMAGKSAFGPEGFTGVNQTQGALMRLEIMKRMGSITQEAYDAVIKAFQEANITPIELTPGQITETGIDYEALTKPYKEKREEELRKLLATGDIGIAPYRRGMEGLKGLSGLAGGYAETLGLGAGPERDKLFEQLSNVRARGNEEDIQTLNTYIQQLKEIENALQNTSISTEDYTNLMSDRAIIITDFTNKLSELNRAILENAQLLREVDLTQTEFAPGTTVQDIISSAQADERAALQRQVDAEQITQEQMMAIIEGTEDVLIALDDTFVRAENVSLDALNKKIKEFEEAGKLLKDSAKGIGFQSQDMTMEEWKSVINGPKYTQLEKQLTDLGYKPQEEDNITILKDGISKDRKDWKIVQFLLQEILKTEQKQVEGMFNLPEGASFWIPYEAAKLFGGGAGGGAGGIPEVTAPGATTTTTTTATATTATTVDTVKYAVDAAIQAEKATTTTKKYDTYADQMKAFRDWESANPPVGSQADQMKKFREADQMPAKTEQGLSLPGVFRFITDMWKNGMVGPQVGLGLGNTATPTGTTPAGVQNTAGLTQALSNLSTKLTITIDNRTSVLVDGRQIASVIKRYLQDDLVRYSGNAASKTVSLI